MRRDDATIHKWTLKIFELVFCISSHGWLPLVLMVFTLYLANMGMVGLVFLDIVDVYPAKIPFLGTSVSTIWMSILVLCKLKLFPLMLHFWGISLTMSFPATLSLLTFIYFLFSLPESKGKSMFDD
ncbi:probable metabolite transport protein CsbC [Drosophila subpulchrella]|uniref:probable metabolite transport protein CsbC n=1 Tax=Drosophila subpulchrella TaxID=1486046 RepID=UPI0018A18094|nr:probable metabolite transport protein CsbC [Drosophila subpulchrella]XP_037711179.1 probable metabolite transport protein CsbC [Drosophila subpulchrella]